jgi:probable rRNA maturation factor
MINLYLDLENATDDDDHPPPSDFKQWISAAIGNSMDEAEISVRIVSPEEITTLNSTYRHQQKATNVLSFPADLPDHIDLPLLGDLVICAQVVEQEAREQNKNSNDHWAHMVIHGTLHLLGYDHIEQHEADVMENLEINILNTMNINNPYLISMTQ